MLPAHERISEVLECLWTVDRRTDNYSMCGVVDSAGSRPGRALGTLYGRGCQSVPEWPGDECRDVLPGSTRGCGKRWPRRPTPRRDAEHAGRVVPRPAKIRQGRTALSACLETPRANRWSGASHPGDDAE